MLDNQELFLLHWVTRKKTGKITSSTPYTRKDLIFCILAEKY